MCAHSDSLQLREVGSRHQTRSISRGRTIRRVLRRDTKSRNVTLDDLRPESDVPVTVGRDFVETRRKSACRHGRMDINGRLNVIDLDVPVRFRVFDLRSLSRDTLQLGEVFLAHQTVFLSRCKLIDRLRHRHRCESCTRDALQRDRAPLDRHLPGNDRLQFAVVMSQTLLV